MNLKTINFIYRYQGDLSKNCTHRYTSHISSVGPFHLNFFVPSPHPQPVVADGRPSPSLVLSFSSC